VVSGDESLNPGFSLHCWLIVDFDHPISPKLARFRSWCYWQNWRAIWALQSCQLKLELVRPSLRVTRLQRCVPWNCYCIWLNQKLLSQNSSLTDLWATFEGVLVIFMRWP
jgi:hypothetical protein